MLSEVPGPHRGDPTNKDPHWCGERSLRVSAHLRQCGNNGLKSVARRSTMFSTKQINKELDSALSVP